MEKVVRDGKVAVLVSPGYGAGWYTWNSEVTECLFDPEVVAWVEGGKVGPCPDMTQKYGYFYMGGADTLEVVWIPVGMPFIVQEYDGKEWVETQEDIKWVVA